MLLASRDNASKLAEIDIIYVADRSIQATQMMSIFAIFANLLTLSRETRSILQLHPFYNNIKVIFIFLFLISLLIFIFFLQDCGSSKSVAQIRAGYHAETRADRRALRNA